jgi:riboflavin synthase
MFTGLIEGVGTLLRMERRGPDAQMTIRADLGTPRDAGLVLGESISVDGACLTVASFSGDTFTADVSAETLARTTLGRKQPGSRVSLERALRFGDRLGGHLVTGHVDGVGTLRSRTSEGRSQRLFFAVPPGLSRFIIEKGSIAVNGISLTVNGSSEDGFDVNIVPHTASQTTIGDLQPGDAVNIETDLIGKYVAKLTAAWGTTTGKEEPSSRIDVDFLKKHGFT